MPDLSNGPVNISTIEREAILKVQEWLHSMGYLVGNLDGAWGQKTAAAWMKFAHDNGLDHLTIDGNLYGAIDAGITDRWDKGPGVNIFDDYGADGGTGLSMGTATDEHDHGDGTGAGDRILDDEEKQRIREEYPSFAWLLDDPDAGPLLEEAIEEGWGPNELLVHLEQTPWFQETQESIRLFDATEARDPATSQARVDQQIVVLRNTFGAYGITISDDELNELGRMVLRQGMSSEQVLYMVGERARAQAKGDQGGLSGGTEGSMAAIVQSLKASAKEYYMGYSEDQFEEWAFRIFEGRWTKEAALATIRNQAAAAYPSLADRIEEGMTMKQYYAPTVNKLAGILNMNPNDIDLSDSRWAPITSVDDGEGGFRSMNFSELNRWGRQQDEFWESDQAAAESYGLAHTILQTFGAI